jgi:hypothetical protein
MPHLACFGLLLLLMTTLSPCMQDKLEDLGGMPADLYLDLIKRARSRITPELVARLEAANPYLQCQETDIGYWKEATQKHLLARKVAPPFPYPELLKTLNEAKDKLERLPEKSPKKAESGSKVEIQTAVRDGRDALIWLLSLKNLPLQAVRDTGLGILAKTLSKGHWHAPVRQLASELVSQWKEAHKSLLGHEPDQVQLLPQSMIDGCADCATWKDLYWYLDGLSRAKMESFRKRQGEKQSEVKKTLQVLSPAAASQPPKKKAAVAQVAGTAAGRAKIALMRAQVAHDSYSVGGRIGGATPSSREAKTGNAKKRKGFFG